MTLTGLREYVDTTIEKYPHLRTEIEDLYALCVAEIEQGESTQNEISLCVGSIDELIEEQNG